MNKKLRPVGEFNQSRTLVQGKHVEHWLNGVKVVEYELNSPAFQAAVAGSKFRVFPQFGSRFRSPVLLQDHGDTVWFRDIKIRELAPGG